MSELSLKSRGSPCLPAAHIRRTLFRRRLRAPMELIQEARKSTSGWHFTAEFTRRMAHQADPKIRRGLTQARGQIDSILLMLTEDRSWIDLAQQLQAVESTIRKVKRALVEDQMQRCIADAANSGTMSGGSNSRR